MKEKKPDFYYYLPFAKKIGYHLGVLYGSTIIKYMDIAYADSKRLDAQKGDETLLDLHQVTKVPSGKKLEGR